MSEIIDFLFSQYSSYSDSFIFLELFAVIMNIISVIYAKQNNILVYPTGLIGTGIFVYILFINIELFINNILEYIELMSSYFVSENKVQNKVTIFPGTYKDGSEETFDMIEINKGEIISIVGPTGSGKSRLLADIEWAANLDTPTKRKVLINGRVLEPHERFSASNKLVAQLSQNMNFVMDLKMDLWKVKAQLHLQMAISMRVK